MNCEKCGKEMEPVVLTSMPPRYAYECFSCHKRAFGDNATMAKQDGYKDGWNKALKAVMFEVQKYDMAYTIDTIQEIINKLKK